jgi:hypothetical protein
MSELEVDGFKFKFPEGWQCDKYDEWSFYRNQFIKQFNGIKAVDVLAVSLDKTAYLIEVKDYSHPDTEKPSELPKAVAEKVIHTLAALLPAKINATEDKERNLATAILECKSVKVVLHIEQPRKHRAIVDLADIKQKLKQLLRAVDAHPKITSIENMQSLNWSVSKGEA